MSTLLTIRDNAVDGDLVDADINGDTIWTSPTYQRVFSANAYRDVRISLQYGLIAASPNNGIEFNGVLEGKVNGGWTPVAYTFDSFFSTEFTREDLIVCDPLLNWSDGGVPNGFFVSGRQIAQVSYNPIQVPDEWRIRVAVLKQTGTVLTGLPLSIYAELYNPE